MKYSKRARTRHLLSVVHSWCGVGLFSRRSVPNTTVCKNWADKTAEEVMDDLDQLLKEQGMKPRTITGRTPTEPNLQNIPIPKTEARDAAKQMLFAHSVFAAPYGRGGPLRNYVVQSNVNDLDLFATDFVVQGAVSVRAEAESSVEDVDKIPPDFIKCIRMYRTERGITYEEALVLTAKEFRKRNWEIPESMKGLVAKYER